MRACLFIEGLRTCPDVVCFQEHKLRLGKTDSIRKEIWAAAHWVCAPAIDGAHSLRNDLVEAGKGGVAIGFHSDFLPFLESEGMVPSLHAVWATFVHPTWGRLGFVGLYGPNDPAGRISLWDELSSSLDTSCRWLFFGDFNMIEFTHDQVGGDGQIMRGHEARAWANFVRTFNLVDSHAFQPGHLRLTAPPQSSEHR